MANKNQFSRGKVSLWRKGDPMECGRYYATCN